MADAADLLCVFCLARFADPETGQKNTNRSDRADRFSSFVRVSLAPLDVPLLFVRSSGCTRRTAQWKMPTDSRFCEPAARRWKYLGGSPLDYGRTYSFPLLALVPAWFLFRYLRCISQGSTTNVCLHVLFIYFHLICIIYVSFHAAYYPRSSLQADAPVCVCASKDCIDGLCSKF